MSTLLAFVAVAAVVIVTPGQDTALTIRNTLTGGRRGGLATAVGVSSGQAVWALATSVGLAAVVVASERVFLAVKLVGAAYLVYLGAHSLWRAWARRGAAPSMVDRSLDRGTAFRQGLVSNLGNPKMAVFFTSLLPQFASGEDAAFLDLLGLGLLFCAMTVVWLAGYALAVDRASAFLRRPIVRRTLDAVTGVVLVALGLRLATERR
jgi:threonine/homoserine/homoserine lactone efflux protein